ncbi:unnamed protein product [Symbiodinium natans]|uniref:Uncharacterized protein n=1 Tax=Symbiodinium natans TaxID=878477 RepID=A0A812K4M0_9DINO|nr:unnamed protein product [Symbiodinium natans]
MAEQRDGLEEQVAAARQETEQLKALIPASELPEDTKLKEIHELEEQSKELANMLDELEEQRNSNQAEKEKLQQELAKALATDEAKEVGMDEASAVRKSGSGMQRVESTTSKPAQVKDLSQLRRLAKEGSRQEMPESTPSVVQEVQPAASNLVNPRHTYASTDDAYAPAADDYAPEELMAGEPMVGDASAAGALAREPDAAEAAEVSRIRARLAELESQDHQIEEKATTVRQRRQDVDSSLGRFAPDAPGRIKEAWQRGVTLGSLLDFFVENCGEVSFEPSFFGNDDDWRRPLCVATKLNRRCHQLNQENRAEIAKKRLRPLIPNVFAVEKLFIRPLTEERRCSMAELWSTSPVDAEIFVSHAWTEDFGEFIQGLTRFAVSLTFRESPALPQDAAASHARGRSFFIHAFSDSMWSDDQGKSLEDLPVYQTLASSSIKTVLLSTGLDGTSLLRAWCCVELFLAKEFGRAVVLNTRLGPMQDQSGPSALTTDIKQFAAMLVQAASLCCEQQPESGESRHPVGADHPLANGCTISLGPVIWASVKKDGLLCVQGAVNMVATSSLGSVVLASVGFPSLKNSSQRVEKAGRCGVSLRTTR